MKLIGDSHVGMVRQNNQDCFALKSLSPTLAYGVVCDGMGGEAGGQLASSLALSAICRRLDTDLSGEGAGKHRFTLESALAAANAKVYERAAAEPALKGMGTTAVVAILAGEEAHIGHVGDSRVYLYHSAGGVLQQVTRDHTVVQMLLERGEITQEEALHHPQRHYITRAVGVSAQIESDYLVCAMGEGDILLLCSDGLYNYLAEEELAALLPRCVAENTVAPLIAGANDGGGGDNITAVLLTRGGDFISKESGGGIIGQ